MKPTGVWQTLNGGAHGWSSITYCQIQNMKLRLLPKISLGTQHLAHCTGYRHSQDQVSEGRLIIHNQSVHLRCMAISPWLNHHLDKVSKFNIMFNCFPGWRITIRNTHKRNHLLSKSKFFPFKSSRLCKRF